VFLHISCLYIEVWQQVIFKIIGLYTVGYENIAVLKSGISQLNIEQKNIFVRKTGVNLCFVTENSYTIYFGKQHC